MKVDNLSIRLRIAKYIAKNLLSNSDCKITSDIKLTRLYCRLGDYKRAIFHAKKVYELGENPEYYYVLKNLYILTNDFESSDNLKLNASNKQSEDIIPILGCIDDSVYDFDKIKFIKDYVKNKGATPLLISLSGKGKELKNLSETEKELLSNIDLYNKERPKWSKENNPPSYIKSVYKNYDNVRFDELFDYRPPVIKATKVLLGDMQNSYVSVKNGLRETVGQPDNYKNKVLCFGTSTTYSVGTSDEDTIVSLIQKEINDHYSDIKVENYGVHGMNLLLAINNMIQTNIESGDVVIFFDYDEFNRFDDEDIYKLDLNSFDRGGDFFVDLAKHHCHFSPQGNKILSKYIVNRFLLERFNNSSFSISNIQPSQAMYQVLDNLKYFLYKKTAEALESCEMKSYLSLLESHVPDPELKVGSVAVNCNPITKGHLHLLEHASRNVDKLFIFVIEEDKSFFRFEDRLHLVAESTKHLENVTVLRGGKFICTELTYPDYFDKDTTEAKADASMEAWFFCEYIAKTLNITQIFLGDEPKCMITKQYNEKMQELLPEYGIEVDIIDRIATNGDVISASKVRKLLEVGDFDGIAQIVPEPTLLFLQENYGKSAA
ncbi:citrate lyase ligase [Vibrio fortis]|uniref:Citrate lyase ligase n=1 Tax=Vibrio fortis TaxID=212667 RepID=A0A066UT04_9VIBR|nr:citrate lyase ligase [Vibrio fortis]KDN27254.1 citrate lyase ligase [Vibrio fortis]